MYCFWLVETIFLLSKKAFLRYVCVLGKNVNWYELKAMVLVVYIEIM